ncbi:MAG: hypothetical protein WAN11_28820 [Syntrophobacteraceae bacterium]
MANNGIPVAFDVPAAPDEMEIMSGATLYLDFLQLAHKELSPLNAIELKSRL